MITETEAPDREGLQRTLRVDVQRVATRLHLSIRMGSGAVLVDQFRDFAELDARMYDRLGIAWSTFRDEVRVRCER